MVYVTAEQIKRWLTAIDDYDNTVITDLDLLDFAEQVAQPYFEEVLAHRKFDNATITEKVDGTDSKVLRLSRFPIMEVEALSINGEAIDISTVYVYSCQIEMETIFPKGRQNIEVTYKGGYPNVPSNVQTAVSLLTAINIARIVGTGASSIETSISAGPIALDEKFAPEGKYYDKIKHWNSMVRGIADTYSGIQIIPLNAETRSPYSVYNPRTDSWI